MMHLHRNVEECDKTWTRDGIATAHGIINDFSPHLYYSSIGPEVRSFWEAGQLSKTLGRMTGEDVLYAI